MYVQQLAASFHHAWSGVQSVVRSPFKTSAFSRNKPSGPTPDNRWLRYVTDPHLSLLMSLVDQQRRGERLSREDSYHYCAIKEQAEDMMATADSEQWTEEDRRVRMLALDTEVPMAGR